MNLPFMNPPILKMKEFSIEKKMIVKQHSTMFDALTELEHSEKGSGDFDMSEKSDEPRKL
jgi:hypothetical protein